MLSVLTSKDVREIDSAAVATGTSVETLMERAGWSVAQVARSLLGGAYGARVVVACGGGNNGGDGRVAARVLRSWGASVEVVNVLEADSQIETKLERADLIIDAIFGVGLSRDVEGSAAKAIAAINATGLGVVAVDIPSGIDADTGQVRGVAIQASRTVTFVGPKLGLLFAPGRDHAGAVDVVDIGTPSWTTEVHAVTAGDVAALWPFRRVDGHKRDSGTLMVVAGSNTMPGAALMTCLAAVRAGVGLITLAAPKNVLASVASAIPEVTTLPMSGNQLEAGDVESILEATPRFDALAIGPGLGRHSGTVEAVAALLSQCSSPAVVDADALVALKASKRTTLTVITPHAGEWSMLSGSDAADAAQDRVSAARRLVDDNTIVVLKGPGTVIASTSNTFVDLEGGPELAQGGTGDALTGVIGRVLAAASRLDRLADTSAEVAAAVWLHSRAAAIASGASREPAGTSLVIDAIPSALEQVLEEA